MATAHLNRVAHMNSVERLDWSLYLVTDPDLVGERPLLEVVAAAIRGGVRLVQYRDKHASTRTMVQTAAALVQLCRRMDVRFLVNDRVDVALAVNADGVHVGQEDMPVALARKLLGPDKLLGVSVHSAAEIRQAEQGGADHLSLSPVFATPTKPDHQTPLGLDGVRALAAVSRLPLIAIGGIQLDNAARVISAGVQGICVVSAIFADSDPEQAARALRRAVDGARWAAGKATLDALQTP
jgi:thiamine-phosphate pyrophosphorylase